MTKIPETVKERLSKSKEEIGEHNTNLIEQFIEQCAALPSEPRESRLLTIATRIRSVSKMLGNKPLDQLKESDLKDLNLAMRQKEMQSASDYRKILKRFLKLKDKKMYFDLIDSPFLANPRKKNGSKPLVDADTFWDERESNRYLEESLTHSSRHSAWASLWLSTGCRPHELLALKKENIKFEEKTNTLLIRVNSLKTGKRSIVLQDGEAQGVWHYLKDYLQTLEDDMRLFDCSYNAILKIHKKICKRAKIGANKKKNFYIARKMTLTRFYNTYGMAKAASMAGHVQGSNSMKNYVAMSEDMLQEKTMIKVEIRTCPNPACSSTKNEPHYSQCIECGSPLDKAKYADIIQRNVNELIDVKLQLFKKELELKLLSGRKI